MDVGQELALTLLTATGVSVAATPAWRWAAGRFGSLDVPNERKVHAHPKPTSGGVAIIAGFLAAALVTGAFQQLHQRLPYGPLGLLSGCAIIVLLGLVDDRWEVPAKIKLLVQVLATFPLLFAGITIDWASNPLAGGSVLVPHWLAWPITILWVIAVTNAINLIDGLDGLAAGVAAIACLALGAVAVTWHRPLIAVFCLALAGGALGYLPYNWHPASIMMGDTGAYFVGYSLAAITILGATKVPAALAIFVPALVLAVPLFDTVLSPVRRFFSGKPAFQPDREHLHHRLLELGFSVPRVVLLIYVVTALCSAIAVWISRKG